MDTVINADDDFSYSTPVFLLTALAGQTVSYGTGTENYQIVTNGFDGVSDITDIDIPPLSEADIEAILAAIGLDDAALAASTHAIFTAEVERLIYEIFSDGSTTDESIEALDDIVGNNGLFDSLPDLVDETLNDDDSVDIVAILGLADQIYQDLDTGLDLTVIIDAGDSFDFVVGKTTVTKLLGQTVSHVSGEDNQQTIVNGLETGTESEGVSTQQASETSAVTEETEDGASQDGFSIIIDTGDDFVFNVGETVVVKMFGQTVSYVTGSDNQQMVTNGPILAGQSANTVSPLQEGEPAGGSAVITDVVTDLPNILISTGDSFDFDIGDTIITKMFGQTVSYASGEHLTQTIVNGFDADSDGSDTALEDIEIPVGDAITPDVTTSEASDFTGSDGIIEILTQVAEIVGHLEGQSDISIVIDTGDMFVFNVDDVEVTKMFGQTVSYANGDDINQTVTNGFELADGSDNWDEALLNTETPGGIDIPSEEFQTEAEQLLDEIFTDDSALAEVISALDEVFTHSSFGSVSGLIAEQQSDDDTTDIVAVLELIRQIRDDLGDGTELSIAIETGDDFQFNIGTTSVTKMFGQTVSYVTGRGNEQTVINGFDINANAAIGGSSDGNLIETLPSQSQADGVALEDDDSNEGFSIVINAGENFIFDIGETDIVKMFGQTVSYASGNDITQTITNGPVVEANGTAEQATQAESGEDTAVRSDPSETSDETEEDANILVEATSTYSFDISSVEVVKMFGQTVSYVSGDRLVQEVINSAVLESADATDGDSLDLSIIQSQPELFNDVSFEDQTIGDTVELLTEVAELIGDLEDPSEFTVAIGAANDFAFDVGEVDIVKLYGQTVSYLEGTDDSQYVGNGSDAGFDWIYDIDSPNLDLTYRMYVAGLGRKPDEEGLRFWTGVLDGLDEYQPWVNKADFLADRFIEAPEFQAIYGVDPSYSDYVDALYWNVLYRAPDDEGQDFWVSRLEQGAGIDDMLVAFAQSAEGIESLSWENHHEAFWDI